MNDRRITLADGTQIEDCDLSCDGASIWLVVPLTIREAAGLFLDDEKTGTMIYGRPDGADQYKGFKTPMMLNAVPGACRVQMTGTRVSVKHIEEQEDNDGR